MKQVLADLSLGARESEDIRLKLNASYIILVKFSQEGIRGGH